MTCRVLPRQRGTIVKCERCEESSFTGQTSRRAHRKYLASVGWSRRRVAGSTSDFCPACTHGLNTAAHARKIEIARLRLLDREERKAETKKKRNERAKAARLAKKAAAQPGATA